MGPNKGAKPITDMHKTVFLLLLSILCLSTAAQQRTDHVIGAHLGFSSTGFLFNRAVNSDIINDSIGLKVRGGSNLPALSITYDYHLSDAFSLGGLLSMQYFEVQLDEIAININNYDTTINSIKGQFYRSYIGLVPRYHFTVANERLDLYAAARIGVILWSVNLQSDQLAALDELGRIGASRIALALVPIGGRYYVADQLAVNFELSIGAPYLLSLGLNYKL